MDEIKKMLFVNQKFNILSLKSNPDVEGQLVSGDMTHGFIIDYCKTFQLMAG